MIRNDYTLIKRLEKVANKYKFLSISQGDGEFDNPHYKRSYDNIQNEISNIKSDPWYMAAQKVISEET